MPVSVSNSAYGIIKDAMSDAGLLQEGDDPNSEQLSVYMRRLCDIINLWQTGGLKLFLLEERSIDLISGQFQYTINNGAGVFPQRNLRVLQGRIVTPQGTYRTISPISWQEWNTLQQTNVGTITSFFIDKRTTSLVINFWPTPDVREAVNTGILLVQTQAANPFNLETDVSFPQEWRIALRWALADDICTGQPSSIMQRCQDRALIFKEQLENWDVEDASTSFALDFRGAYSTRGYR